MRTAPLLVAVLLGAAGCKKAVEAPEDVESMMNFAFVHHGDEDEGPLMDVADNMRTFVADHLEEAETGWQVNSLSDEDLAAAGVDQDVSDGILGASASVPYRNAVDPVAVAITHDDKTEVFEHVKEYEVLTETDKACFLARECPTYEFSIRQVASASILGEATLEQDWEMRWVGLDNEVGFEPMYFIRTLAPDGIEFGSGAAKVHQQYSIAAVYPDSESRRLEAFWVDMEVIGLDIPEDFGVNQAINQIGKSAEAIDEFIENGPIEQ